MILNYYHAYLIITMPEICKIFGLMNILELCLFSQTNNLYELARTTLLRQKGAKIWLFIDLCVQVYLFL